MAERSHNSNVHEKISILKTRCDCPSKIAKTLGVPRSKVTRELHRNSEGEVYSPEEAQKKTENRRKRSPAKKMSPDIIAVIEEKLRLNWSPEQISGWLKRKGKNHVSYETIYQYIWADKKRGGTLYKNLRHSGKKYYKRSKGTAGRGCIPGRIDIKERPAIVEEKIRLGDWELDTIIGGRRNL